MLFAKVFDEINEILRKLTRIIQIPTTKNTISYIPFFIRTSSIDVMAGCSKFSQNFEAELFLFCS